MSVSLKSNTAGSASIQVNGSDRITFNADGGVNLQEPCFGASMPAQQSIANNTFQKVAVATKEFDTNNNYDKDLYRFTPNIAGYYEVKGSVGFSNAATGIGFCMVYKNGNRYRDGTVVTLSNGPVSNVSALVYLNGISDYVELYTWQNSGSALVTQANATSTTIAGYLVRAA